MHWRIDVAKRPLIRRQLPVRMHVPLAQQQNKLVLGKIGVHKRQRNRVERQVPGREPGIFPFVRIAIASFFPFRRRSRLPRIAFDPRSDVIVIALLGPQQPRNRLAQNVSRIIRAFLRKTVREELVRFGAPQFKCLFEFFAEWFDRLRFKRWICLRRGEVGCGLYLKPA